MGMDEGQGLVKDQHKEIDQGARRACHSTPDCTDCLKDLWISSHPSLKEGHSFSQSTESFWRNEYHNRPDPSCLSESVLTYTLEGFSDSLPFLPSQGQVIVWLKETKTNNADKTKTITIRQVIGGHQAFTHLTNQGGSGDVSHGAWAQNLQSLTFHLGPI